jgi:hypothetical protein
MLGLHSMTSLARESSDSGTSMPRALAVFCAWHLRREVCLTPKAVIDRQPINVR